MTFLGCDCVNLTTTQKIGTLLSVNFSTYMHTPKQTRAMISVSLLRERENLRSSTQVRDTLYLATTKAGLNGSAMVPCWVSLTKGKAFTASKRFL